MTSDSLIAYSDDNKTLTLIQKGLADTNDTVQIKLFRHSVKLFRNKSQLELLTLASLPDEIQTYHFEPYFLNGAVRGLSFWAPGKYIKIEIWDFPEKWTWNIVARQASRVFAITYNGFRANRVEHIFVQDHSLKCGMAISMTFKSLKKMALMSSSYVDTVTRPNSSKPVIADIQVDRRYKFKYDKAGRLTTSKISGELRLCECK